jgi:hypothetical protein
MSILILHTLHNFDSYAKLLLATSKVHIFRCQNEMNVNRNGGVATGGEMRTNVARRTFQIFSKLPRYYHEKPSLPFRVNVSIGYCVFSSCRGILSRKVAFTNVNQHGPALEWATPKYFKIIFEGKAT